MKIPNATHNWKLVTRPPRIEAGEISALKTGMVDTLIPIPCMNQYGNSIIVQITKAVLT